MERGLSQAAARSPPPDPLRVDPTRDPPRREAAIKGARTALSARWRRGGINTRTRLSVLRENPHGSREFRPALRPSTWISPPAPRAPPGTAGGTPPSGGRTQLPPRPPAAARRRRSGSSGRARRIQCFRLQTFGNFHSSITSWLSPRTVAIHAGTGTSRQRRFRHDRDELPAELQPPELSFPARPASRKVTQNVFVRRMAALYNNAGENNSPHIAH